jgi:hypothetical protein
LHPLAVEDALRSSNSPRSKLDFYRSHLYLQLLIHHIHHPDEAADEAALDGGVFHEDDGGDHVFGHDDEAELGVLPSGGKRKGTIQRLREVLGGAKSGYRQQQQGGSGSTLPEGVEGVFAPMGGGMNFDFGESVRMRPGGCIVGLTGSRTKRRRIA